MHRSNNKMTSVENNLLPPMVIDGSSNNGSNIFDEMKWLRVPSIAITIIEGGKISWSQEYHQSIGNDSHDQTANLSIFQAASISKVVNAVLVLRVLIESGKIQLDEDVNPYLKRWKIPGSGDFGDKVTVRRLLSHTSGINVGGFPGYLSTNKMIPDVEKILIGNPDLRPDDWKDTKEIPEGLVNTPPVQIVETPGAKFAYSGGGVIILQKLIEDVTGESYAELARRYIFEPLKMSSSSFKIKSPNTADDNIQPATGRDGKTIDGRWHVYPESAAAGLWSTSEDLAKFTIAVQQAFLGNNSDFLSRELAHEMLTLQPNSKCGLGYFLTSEEHQGELAISHSGGNEGYQCHHVMLPNKGDGVVVMTNSDNGMNLGFRLIRGVFDTYGWPGLRPEMKKVASLDAGVLEKCIGEFKIKADHGSPNALLGINEGKLFIKLPFPSLDSKEVKDFVLLPESDHDFFNPDENLTIKFSADYGEITFCGLTAVKSAAAPEQEPQLKNRLV